MISLMNFVHFGVILIELRFHFEFPRGLVVLLTLQDTRCRNVNLPVGCIVCAAFRDYVDLKVIAIMTLFKCLIHVTRGRLVLCIECSLILSPIFVWKEEYSQLHASSAMKCIEQVFVSITLCTALHSAPVWVTAPSVKRQVRVTTICYMFRVKCV